MNELILYILLNTLFFGGILYFFRNNNKSLIILSTVLFILSILYWVALSGYIGKYNMDSIVLYDQDHFKSINQMINKCPEQLSDIQKIELYKEGLLLVEDHLNIKNIYLDDTYIGKNPFSYVLKLENNLNKYLSEDSIENINYTFKNKFFEKITAYCYSSKY